MIVRGTLGFSMRRLPVIQQSAREDDAAAARPPWQWSLIGGGLATTIWVPFALLVLPLGAAPVLLAFGAAAGLAGALVGRFGGRAGPREAALGGILAAVLVTSIAAVAGAGLPPRVIFLVVLLLALVGAGAGFAGGRFGVRKRPC